MYSKRRTLAEKFSLTNQKIDIPRDAILDSIDVKCTAVIHNGAGTDYAGTLQAVLDSITSMRVISDGNKVHYSLNGLDCAILNYYSNESIAPDPDEVLAITAGADKTVSFMLTLDEGDILAALKDSLEFTLEVKAAITADVAITAFTGLVSVSENVMTPQEFVASYGADAVNSAEPKVTSYEKAFDAADELREFLDLPTGTLLRRAFLIVKDSNGVRNGTVPTKIGLIRTTPDRSEMFTIDYSSFQIINERKYKLHNGFIPGVVAIDYGSEITNDNFGLRGWKYNKGDYQAAIKAAAAGKVRYLSVEYVVNTPTFDQLARAATEATE
jgi:hypothetical protein